ncbi:ABC transporter permease [Paenibacillus koleovorans]|uniref:ABC transporter permease n=1 Tax=Paenibacillus koleovorans TaxID=121608 RepID=UPI000FDAB774|nr:ABC transporter permease [Paenibacillus koleovorans]
MNTQPTVPMLMTQFLVLYRKELLEMRRSYKWLWVPLVFILLGATQPISTYYMPEILQASGGLPEGTVIQIPTPSAGEMMAKTLSQFSSIGILVFVLASMGVVAAERASGAIHMVMLKPVPVRSYLLAKWAGLMSLALTALTTGSAAGWYYTEVLIGHVDPVAALRSIGLYVLWFGVIAAFTVLASSGLRSLGAIAFVVIGTLALLSVVTGLLAGRMQWSPTALTGHAAKWLTGAAGAGGGAIAHPVLVSILLALALIPLLMEAAVPLFQRKLGSS